MVTEMTNNQPLTYLETLLKINNTPLMELNPNAPEYRNNPHALLEIILRFKFPWQNKINLKEAAEVISDTFDVNEHDPLVGLITQNPCEEITAADLFVDGDPSVIVVRVFTIENGDQVADSVRDRCSKEEGLWRRELLGFDEDEPTLFVDHGHIYVSPDYPKKNQVLWDGENYRVIDHKEDNVDIPEETWLLNGEPIWVGGYNRKDKINAELEALNNNNKTCWQGQIGNAKLVGKPYYLIENTYVYYGDILSDSIAMLNNALDSIEN